MTFFLSLISLFCQVLFYLSVVSSLFLPFSTKTFYWLLKKNLCTDAFSASLSWVDHQKVNYISDRKTQTRLRMETLPRARDWKGTETTKRGTFIEINYLVLKIFQQYVLFEISSGTGLQITISAKLNLFWTWNNCIRLKVLLKKKFSKYSF